MADSNNEPREDGLDTLPAAERKETEEILSEIDSDAKAAEPEAEPKAEPEKPKEPTPSKEPVAEEAKKPDDGQLNADEDKSKGESRKPRKMVPAYVLEIERDKAQKREKDLLDQLAAAGKGNSQIDDAGKKTENFDKEVQALVEKHGITKELAEDMLNLSIKNGGRIPEDAKEDLAAIKKIREDSEIAQRASEAKAAELEFSADFDRLVLPLIKAEYGDDVPPDVVKDLKDQFTEIAHTAEFEKVPLAVLYKGEDKFRGVIPPKKRGAEATRGGSQANIDAGGEKLDLTKPLTDDAIKNLTDEQFDTYSKNMEKVG